MADNRKLRTYKKKAHELKRSRPIGVEQISQAAAAASATTPVRKDIATSSGAARTLSEAGIEVANSPCTNMGRKSLRGEKEGAGKKERWLLTRKTWKYMQQAGRRLIPDGSQNRPDDLPKIEEYFQHVCRAEQRFILWSRKSSYPGAIAASRKLKRRIRCSQRTRSQSHQQQKASSADEAEVDEFKEYDRRAAVVIRLLHSYLNIAELDKRGGQQKQQADRVAEQQRAQVTAQTQTTRRVPATYESGESSTDNAAALLDLTKRTTELLDSLRLYTQAAHRPIIPTEHITSDLLNNKALLRKIYNDLKQQQLSIVLNRHTAASSNSNLSHASSLTSLFNFRRTLPKTSPAGSTSSGINVKLRHLALDNSPANIEARDKLTGSHLDDGMTFKSTAHKSVRTMTAAASADLGVPVVKEPTRTYHSQGIQTDFLALHKIDAMRKEYEAHKKEQELMNQAADDDVEQPSKAHSRRKSSVDNEDVSQSVSDTIKRYLRMARKKSVNDDAANRFKRVNYDRNLRNIRAKGEINPPGMDDGNSKATQTLDAWPLLHYNYIRGVDCELLLEEAHADWNGALQRRLQQQQEYLEQQRLKDEQQQQQQQSPSSPKHSIFSSSHHSTSQPAGPVVITALAATSSSGAGGLFHSGTQFFSNLWHGYHQSNCNSSTTTTTTNIISSYCTTTTTITTTTTTTNITLYSNATTTTSNLSTSVLPNRLQTATPTQIAAQHQSNVPTSSGKSGGCGVSISTRNIDPSAAMQKSKSSSNVGQFVSKKIWKSRSKSQSRIPTANKPQWAPQGNCIWMSPSGKRVVLSDSRLRDLAEIERKILHRVAIEKINQLNIGVNVTAPDVSTASQLKSQKRRPLLIKRKAVTTSIFDTNKKDENKANGSGLVFGVSIEKCVDNDRVQRSGHVGSSSGGGSDRGSRNSIISLLGGGNHNKSTDHVGSCESLPSRSTNILGHYEDGGGGGGGGGGGNSSSSMGFINSALMKISRSQTDIRRGSQDDDELLLGNSSDSTAVPPMVGGGSERESGGQQVPALVLECIKHIEEHGMHTVGIFRVSTSKKRVRQLKEGFDRGEITVIESDICPHDVATILKEYLRDLPEPLLCRNLYKAFVKTQKIRNRRLQLEALSHLIQLLPVAHRDTLYALLRFLAKIVRSSDDATSNDTIVTGNKMDSNNLATVIAPNILRSTEQGRTTEQEIDEQIDVINVIRTMIDHYEDLFRVPAELMDEIYTNMMDTHPEQLDYLCEKRDMGERYDDDMDSASSNTPLSSPPPIGIVQQYPALTTSASNTTAAITDDNGTSSDRAARPIYSRDDFLHENTIKGGDPNGNLAVRRRERASRMKYIESEHELSRRRRRERNLSESGSNAASPTTPVQSPIRTTFNSCGDNWFDSINNSGQTQQQQGQASTATSRLLSSPYDEDGGVVKASLKIPVQMQQTPMPGGHQQQQQPLTGGGYCDSGQIDLSDIPYIEDNGCVQDILTGSLQFGHRRNSNATATISSITGSTTSAYQIPIAYDGRMLNSPTSSSSEPTRSSIFHQYDDTSGATSAASSRRSSDNLSQSQKAIPTGLTSIPQQQQSPASGSQQPKRPDSLKRSARKQPPSNIPGRTAAADSSSSIGASAESSPSSVLSPTTLLGQFSALQAAHHHHINTEPKLTPSISNIGGALLRSKTADFERIVKENKKYKTSDSGGGSGVGPDETTVTGIVTTSTITPTMTTSPPAIPERRRQQSAGGNSTRGTNNLVYKRQELISSAQRNVKKSST